MDNKGLEKDTKSFITKKSNPNEEDFVFIKSIFSKVFEKDIRKVYLHKKAQRLAKALVLLLPAFKDIRVLRDRLECAIMALLEASADAGPDGRVKLSRELVSLSSLIDVASSGGYVSHMNAEIIGNEVRAFLEEISSYEDPHISLEDSPSLSVLARFTPEKRMSRIKETVGYRTYISDTQESDKEKGHKRQLVKDASKNGRRDEIIAVLKSKGAVRIKDISMLVKKVSEKTIQRELQTLVSLGQVVKEGKRRWTTYALPFTEEKEPAVKEA